MDSVVKGHSLGQCTMVNDETIRAENVPVEGYVALANAWDAARGFPD